MCSACVCEVGLDVVALYAAGELRNGFSSPACVRAADGKYKNQSISNSSFSQPEPFTRFAMGVFHLRFFSFSFLFQIMLLINRYKIPDMLSCCKRPLITRTDSCTVPVLVIAFLRPCSLRNHHSRPGLALTLKRHSLCVKLEDGCVAGNVSRHPNRG